MDKYSCLQVDARDQAEWIFWSVAQCSRYIMLLYDGSGHVHAKSAGKCPSKDNLFDVDCLLFTSLGS